MCHKLIKTFATVFAAACFFVAGRAEGEPVPDPVMHITNIPELPVSSFYYGARFNSEGLLHLWDGSCVWRQDGVNVDGFTPIGAVVGNMADAGPIQFSRDETRMLLGNGAGGWGPYWGEPQHAGRIFSMPAEGSIVSQAIGDIDYHYDFATLPQQSTIAGADQKFFVNYGWEYYMSDPKSWVSVFDAVTGDNRVVLADIPGASGAIAVDDDGSLYACVGYGAARGLIKRFDVEDVDEAFNTGVPLAWEQGTSLNPDNYDNQSAAGMFFDSRGFLFAGGNEGLTVFRPDGTSGTYAVGGAYSSVTYNPLNDQVLVMTNDEFTYEPIFDIYEAADFLPARPGDANCDDKVDQQDAAILAKHWLLSTGADWFDGDFNGDNAVDGIDAALMAVNWNCGGVGTGLLIVPEPSTLRLIAGICLGLFILRLLEGISKPQFALQAVFLPAGLRREISPYPPICRRFCSLPAETKILAFVIKVSFETPSNVKISNAQPLYDCSSQRCRKTFVYPFVFPLFRGVCLSFVLVVKTRRTRTALRGKACAHIES